MKFSLAFSVLILTAAAGLGWRDHQRLVAVRDQHSKLVVEAANLGFLIDPKNPSGTVRLTKHERENQTVAAHITAAGLIAFAREMEAMQADGRQPGDAMQKRILDFIDQMMSLDPAQLKMVIAEFRASPDLKDETRQGLISFAIMTLANTHPQAALAIFTESSELFKNTSLVSNALSKWAKDDPTAALDWVRKNTEKFPDLVDEDAKRGIISGAAQQDPKLAFQLIGELGLKDVQSSVSKIVHAAKTPEERTATLSALREYAATIPDKTARTQATESGIAGFAQSVQNEGFDSATHWLETAKLSPAELSGYVSGLNSNFEVKDAGRWIEWIGEKLPPDKSRQQITELVRDWVTRDFQAAGTWLATCPESSAKNLSIQSYAETISPYDPESAAQWAKTLPAGKDRNETLRAIYDNWPQNDPASKAAAAAFAKANGIK